MENVIHKNLLGSLDSDWPIYLKWDFQFLFLEVFDDVMTSSDEISNFEKTNGPAEIPFYEESART